MECGILQPDTRTHVKKTEISSEEVSRKLKSDDQSVRMSQKNSGSDLAANYVLRENPKKTKRFGDSKEQKVCKECGKGFQSLKALCGHMASHSDKDKMVKKFQEQKLVMDGHSDTETSGPRQKRRVSNKRIIRYKNLDVYSGSSSVSGIEQEQQEVAISLMLLSRDSGYKGGLDLNLNSLADSSDNNSVVLEAKSSSIDMNMNKVANFDEEKLKSGVGASVSENSDSGYFRNGPKKIESDVSVDGFLKNGEFRKLEVESGSGIGANKLGISDEKSGQLGKRILVDEEEKDEENCRGSSKYELRKRTKNGLYRGEALMESCKDESNYAFKSEICRNFEKRSKYECLTCNKTFKSHRALGGHRANHSKINGCCEPICESGENNIENDNSTPEEAKIIENGAGKTPIREDFIERKSGSKKSRGHECPICFRMFKSGQALGGHKRSHFVGGREANSTMVIREEEPPEAEITVLFDLNLPAPMEEDNNEDVEFMAW
ncbi:Zinc finger protein ZAT4 [Morus notabilis]|uniref:Zinc finger protein ZAT4 n=1 Tax=Morus notabilis TaxID=981085 RepID=W9SRB9_9ROSA|nr:uncharacterized protein LOC21390076 [Morus notabilis]EXC22068.1 Zinc finger protein ZAT4 [Morus notabilis]